MPSIQLAFLALAVHDVDWAVGFYQGLLGQSPQPYQPGRYGEFHLPGLRLALFRPQDSQVAEFNASTSGSMSLCLEVADLESAIAHLTRLGYPPPGAILTASHGREIYAYDPDGNRLILHVTE
ncbi:VOC family protein [Leptolyngbya sp. PCC 6406]|uniref:VOC family protein n=1 Tax=Leptolyngbya sp. PCC 6406 TaxID=1173264 RepID=UPI0002AC58F7|nr:VOC family protein [Leptolyngbya sp. PCC 6406]